MRVRKARPHRALPKIKVSDKVVNDEKRNVLIYFVYLCAQLTKLIND